MALPTKEERIRRKKVMLDAGINVPNTDESWGPWWDELWKKATTHTKTNDYYGVPSVWNFMRRTWDNATGNTTYEAEPLPIGGTILATDESVGALIKRTLNNWQHQGDPVRDITLTLMPDPSKPVKAGKAVVKAAPLLVKSVPALFTKTGAKKAGTKIAEAVIREVPRASISYAGGKGVDAASKALTGKSWGENVADKVSNMAGFHIEPIFGEVTNPGYIGGYKYGNFVSNNVANRNRYFFDEVRPQHYNFENVKSGFKALGRMFYEKPPVFNVKFDASGKVLDTSIHPKWYNRNAGGLEKINPWRELAWAKYLKIPESEVQNVLYLPNKDGSFRYNPNYINDSYTRRHIADTYHFDRDSWRDAPWVDRDYFTTNGGNVGMKKYAETTDQIGVEMFDKWDLLPGHTLWDSLFKGKINTPKFVKNWEAGRLLGGEPFDMRTRFVVDKEPLKNFGYYDGDIGFITDF